MADATCGRCGGSLETVPGGMVFLCGPDLWESSGSAQLPPTTRGADSECRSAEQRDRDEDALKRAIARGVILP